MTDRPLDDFLQDILREIERIERFIVDVTSFSPRGTPKALSI